MPLPGHFTRMRPLSSSTSPRRPWTRSRRRKFYSRFNEIAGDKTAVYISHRLSSCRFCDEILVFHEGSVIQQGSHAELVADENGKYYELWRAQAQYYVN